MEISEYNNAKLITKEQKENNFTENAKANNSRMVSVKEAEITNFLESLSESKKGLNLRT